MQYARWGTNAKDPKSSQSDDLSQYLRQDNSASDAEMRRIAARPSRMAGSMNNVGSTLIVGKPKTQTQSSSSGGAGLHFRNFSEPILQKKAHTLLHSRSTGASFRGISNGHSSGNPRTIPADTDHKTKGDMTEEPEQKVPDLDAKPLQDSAVLTVWFHEPAAYAQDVVVDPSALAGLRAGNIYELMPIRRDLEPNRKVQPSQKLVFLVRSENYVLKSPAMGPGSVNIGLGAGGGTKPKGFQISLASNLQKLLDVPPRSSVNVKVVHDTKLVELDTVEIHIKDVNFPRDSQWSLSSSLVGTCCYTEQRVLYMGSRVGVIKNAFKNGRRIFSGYIGSSTSIVFRSESAKLLFLIQLSKEMWHFEENGEIMFHKLVNTLFPMVFKNWRGNNAHHAITIVLFTTVDFTRTAWMTLGGGERPSHCQEYYRVVVDQVSVYIWDKIMANLRLEFANFKRDILLHMEANELKIKGEPCPSLKGNLLEAINLSLTLVSDRYKSSDLRHSLSHLVVVTPGAGLFDVDYDLMLETSKKVLGLDYALDIVSLSQPPLHTVPLFRYRTEMGEVSHCVPKWCDMSFYGSTGHSSSQWIPRCKIYELQMMGLMENEVRDVLLDRIEFKENVPVIESMNDYDDAVFGPVKKKPLIVKNRFEKKKGKKLTNAKSTATLSLMRTASSDQNLLQRATTNVSTTTSSVNGLVSNLSMSNSALSALYTLNKADDVTNVPGRKLSFSLVNPGISKPGRSPSGVSDTSNQASKIPRVTADANLRNEISKSSHTNKKPRTRDPQKVASSKEKRKSALAIEISEREENNPYWMPIENPSEPQTATAAQSSRWADTFPPKIKRKIFKWRSLKAPASLPIGTKLFPSSSQMESEYTFQTYVVSLNWENRLELKTTRDLMREMIRLRLSLGFQICYGNHVKKFEADRKSGGYPEGIIKYFPSGDCIGARVYLSLNNEIHRIFLDYNGSLNVQLYKKVNSEEKLRILLGSQNSSKKQHPLIRTRYADEYSPSKVTMRESLYQYLNWNQMDQLIAGYEDAVPDISKHFRQMKFVVIPGPVSTNAYHINNEKLTDEEIRLEGLRKLIALIERGRYKTKEEMTTKKGEEIFQEINFYTGNLHDFLNEQAEYFDVSGTKPSNSLMITDGLRFNTNIKLAQLAQELQTDDGLKLVDRTWHFKVHTHCFLGSDLVSWLIKLFDDIESREEATEYGQTLMDRKMINHVESRHNFLDGHYFYGFCDEYLDHNYKAKVEKRSWFRKKQPNDLEEHKEAKEAKEVKSPTSSTPNTPLAAAPNTPLTAGPNTPTLTQTNTRSNSITSTGSTPLELRKVISLYLLQDSEASSLNESQRARRRKKFMISKHVKYNCDSSGKSFRPELVDVHYDTVHNPEHCYHIRLQWLNTTTKFIDETIINWSRFCERYGLKLVETPWRELCTIPEINPFHSFVDLKFALNPLQDSEFKDSEVLKRNKFYYHLHFLKVNEFLLDNRGTAFFLKENNEICYSWGRASFKYAQFIHSSGAYMVELRDDGEFCMAPNNVHILRMNTFVNPGSDLNTKTNILDTQRVMMKFRERCRDEDLLRQVFREASKLSQDEYDAAYAAGM